MPIISGGGSGFNGGTITAPTHVQGAQTASGLLSVHETAVTGGLFGLLVTDPGNNVYIASTRTAGGFNTTLLTNPINGGINVWSDFDNDGTAGLSVDNSHNVNVGASPGDGGKIGFYGHAPTAQQTGVAVTAAGIHAACVALGLFTA